MSLRPKKVGPIRLNMKREWDEVRTLYEATALARPADG